MSDWKKIENISFSKKLKNIFSQIRDLELDKRLVEHQKIKIDGLKKIAELKKKKNG